MPLHADSFFSLEGYAHRALFADSTFVWEAIKKIKSYLAGFSLGTIEVDIPKGAFLIHPELISIGAGSIIEPGAYIKGPCILGKGCQVRHGAYIRGDFLAGDECVIGHASEVKHAIFLNRTQAPHFAYIGDSILGNQVNLGAGVKCANLRLDAKEIVIHFEGVRYPTGLRKFGAIVGDEARVGCNAVLNPGTLLGKNTLYPPCSNVSGVSFQGEEEWR